MSCETFTYCHCCVDWPTDDMEAEGGLSDRIGDAIDIRRETFLKHVDREEMERLESELGYASHPNKGITMARDYHVSYHPSTLHGERVYFFKQSAIEHVFTQPDEMMREAA